MSNKFDSILQRYNDMRIQCLRWGNLHPGSSEVCHQSLRYVHGPAVSGITLAMAALADDMAIAIKEMRKDLALAESKGE